MEDLLKTLGNWIVTKGIQALIATVVLIVLWWVINVTCKSVKKKIMTKKIDTTVASVSITVTRVLLKIVLIGFYIGFLGVETSSIAAAIASIGLTIGLALQGSLSNLAGGVVILVTHLFKVGDYIECDGKEGTVENIELFFTTLVTLQNQVIVIPNSTVANSVIKNYSTKDERRLDLTFSISYDSDFMLAKQLILDCVNESGLAIDTPAAPFVKICKHNESSIDLVTRVWTHSCDYWNLNFYLLEAVKLAFDLNDISIPFPQLDVHIQDSNKINAHTVESIGKIGEDKKRLESLKKSLSVIEKPASSYVIEEKRILALGFHKDKSKKSGKSKKSEKKNEQLLNKEDIVSINNEIENTENIKNVEN